MSYTNEIQKLRKQWNELHEKEIEAMQRGDEETMIYYHELKCKLWNSCAKKNIYLN
jgi:hypothetical protein